MTAPSLGSPGLPRRTRRRAMSGVGAFAVWLVLLMGGAAGIANAAPLWSSLPKPFSCTAPGGGIVTSNKCLKHTNFDPNAGSGLFTPWWGQYRHPKGNCTAYVAYRLQRNGAKRLASSFGGAYGWRRVVIAKLGAKAVDDRPAVGAIAWWSRGHVAYVEKVSSDRRTIHLSESHWPTKWNPAGSRRLIVKQGSSYWPDDFLHIKDKPRKAPASKPKSSPTQPVEPEPMLPSEPVLAPAPPKGNFEVVSSPDVGKVRVRGWTFDPDSPRDALDVHVYVGGRNHKISTANLPRNDVANAYANAEDPGPDHGFETTFPTSLKGSQEVCVYAINIGQGPNPKLGCKVVTIKAPPAPSRSVSISKGGSAQGMPGCVSVYCRYVVVSFKNFSSGSHSITCRASHGSEGGYYTYTRSGSSNTSTMCYYGFPGHTFWVTVDGVSSNRIGW